MVREASSLAMDHRAAELTGQSPVLVIEAGESSFGKQAHDLWEHREFFYFLTWRDIKVRNKQTILGVAWAVIQSFFTMVVFSIFFGYLGKITSDGIPYPVFACCALLPWSLFARALTESSNSLVSNQSLITKVYFPRLIIPIAPLFVGLLDCGIACLVLIGMMLCYGIVPGIAILTTPLFVLLALLTALAVGMWPPALNVQYCDVRYPIQFLTQLWHFATPVAYPSSLLPEPWRSLYGLNPMAGVVEGFRWALLGQTRAPRPRPSHPRRFSPCSLSSKEVSVSLMLTRMACP